MKSYLILINNAPKMAEYHKHLGDSLKEQGNKVAYAMADSLPLYTYNLDFSQDKLYIFSNFFRENQNNSKISPCYQFLDLWKMYFADYDRYTVHYNLTTHDSLYYEQLLSNLVSFFDSILKSTETDIVIYENISNSFAYTCFEVAKFNNIQYRGYVNSRLSNRFEVHTEEFGIKERFKSEFEKKKVSKIEDNELEEINQYLSKFNSNTIPSYHPKNSPLSGDYSLSKRYLNKHKFLQIKGSIKFYFKEYGNFKYSYQVQNPLNYYFTLFKRQLKKKYRVQAGKKLFENQQQEEKYLLFPMHFKPESSTSVLAKNFCDDLAVIKNLAFNIPFGYKLYVKEHFVNYGNYPLSFYKELKKIPNVKLISSEANTMDLVKKCKALLTLTGTMGYEALFLNKNVIVFGNVFYQVHPNCIKLTNYEELHNTVLHLKELPQDIKTNQAFVAAYRACTYEGNVAYSFFPTEDFSRFSKAFINALRAYDYSGKK